MIKKFYSTVPAEYDANLNKTWIADAPFDCYNISVTVTYNKKEDKYDVHS